jgi:hypothetical protein
MRLSSPSARDSQDRPTWPAVPAIEVVPAYLVATSQPTYPAGRNVNPRGRSLVELQALALSFSGIDGQWLCLEVALTGKGIWSDCLS